MTSSLDSHVIQVAEAAVSAALPDAERSHEQSFAAAGGTSVDALMVVDDILMRLELGDHLASPLLAALMLATSLEDFPHEVVKLVSRETGRPG
jgi:hypothetical protein